MLDNSPLFFTIRSPSPSMRRCVATCLVHMQQLVSTPRYQLLARPNSATLQQRRIPLAPLVFPRYTVYMCLFPKVDPSPAHPTLLPIPSYHPCVSSLLNSLLVSPRDRPVFLSFCAPKCSRLTLLRSRPRPPFIIAPLFFSFNRKFSLAILLIDRSSHLHPAAAY